MRMGVVIQGPVISRGISGKDWPSSIVRNIPKENFNIDYDGSQNIIDSYRYFTAKGFRTVVSVWDTCDTTRIEKAIPMKDILRSNQSTLKDHFPPDVYGLPKYYQLWTLKKGIDEIAMECDCILKTRTDFYLQPETFDEFLSSDFFKNWCENPQTGFLMPYFLKHRLLAFSDFYFLAKTRDYIELLEGCFTEKKFQHIYSVHYLLPMTYFDRIKLDRDLVLRKLYEFSTLNYREINIAKNILINDFLHGQKLLPMPENVFRTSLWRGGLISSSLDYERVSRTLIFLSKKINQEFSNSVQILCSDLFYLRRQSYPPFKRWNYILSKEGLILLTKTLIKRAISRL